MYTMADYESKAHNVYLTSSYLATSKLRFHATINYNMSTGSLKEVVMPDISSRLNGALSHQDFTFNEMHTYSDLDYKLMQLTFGTELKVSPRVTVTADVDYADLTDDTGYIYGIESGKYFLIRSGIRFDF